MEGQFAGRMFLQEIEHRFALAENLRAIALARGGIVARIGQKFRLCYRAARMFRHDLDLPAGRHLLQFDEIGQQSPDGYRLADGQLCPSSLGDPQTDLIGGKKSKTASHGIDECRIVARHDAQMIADAIAGCSGQLHLDMPGRSLRGVAAKLVLQFVVGKHFHRRGTAERHHRIGDRRRHGFDPVQRLILGAAGKTRTRCRVPWSPAARAWQTSSRIRR